ncbi:MAG: hypothetical protein OEU09_21080 [Rhodospirillales bacterium]|nr:hypothetical protein [Rhodospirillales bacterium]MDH3913781.1 hypothetical protein [Rhodospirillales bacterium]MDH3916991.1 hypothetical protein [Rhodospirillales bacterium]
MTTHSGLPITWTAANSKSVPFGTTEASDAISPSAGTIAATLQLRAKNDGAPQAGDTVTCKIRFTTGDTDGAGGDEFDTFEHAMLAVELDTSLEDPAERTIQIPWPWKGAIVSARNNSAGRNITVSGIVYELKS